MRPTPAAALTLLLTAACGGGPEGGGRGEPPLQGSGTARSFLLVTLDTTRADHLSAYGAADAETPHLAALAAGGAVFERAFAATPVTLPSHASLLTGLDPPAHGVRNNGIHYLPEEIPTLAGRLAAEGFATAAFVSAAVLDHRYGLDRGFDLYDDDLSAGRPKELRMIAERPAEVTVAAARAWLDALPQGGRFFVWVHLFDPHIPYDPPPPWRERFRDRPYDGEIAYLDSELGRLLSHPRLAAGQGVLVMAVGDHGESLGEHGEASHAMLAYDATLRVPWIVCHPGAPRGLRLAAPVAHVDLLPTALELLGLGASRGPHLAGESRAAAIRGGAEGAADRPLYAETLVPFYTYGWAKLRALRKGEWKLIDAPAPELYDLRRDPGELENLHPREPGRAAELAKLLEERVREERPPRATLPADRPEMERLRSLGYLASRRGPEGDLPDSERPDPKAMIDLHQAMERAQAHLYARDFEGAVVELRRVLTRDRGNLAALADLAKALTELGRRDEALEALRRALARAPEQADLHVTLAGLRAARGEPGEALEALDAALALDPRNLDARVEKARLLFETGRGGEGEELLEVVLAEAPDHGRATAVWAERVALPAGEVTAAEQRLARVVAREPFLAEGWRALARVRQAAGRPDDARAALRRGLTFQPRDPGLNALLGILLAEAGGGEEALPHLTAALELSPEPLPEVHDALAAVAAGRGDWAAMEAAAGRAVELDPGLASAWNHLAVAREEQGKVPEALAAYERALAADSGYWQAHFNRGLLRRKLGRSEEAAADFREVLERVPDHAGSHYELGVLYGGFLGRPDLARRHLEASLSAEPDHPRAAEIRRLLATLPPVPSEG